MRSCMNKKIIVVFDFDGTLTTKDTLLEFVKFCFGTRRLCIGLFCFLPLIFLMKLGVYSNWKCKQKFFSWFYKDMEYEKFKELGRLFAKKACSLLKDGVVEEIQRFQKGNAYTYIVSASVEDWVAPVASCLKVDKVLGTKVEVNSEGKLTGFFSTENCYGQEKVNRFLKEEPNRDEYYLYAYGDSRGDKEMIAFADEGFWV